MTQIRYGGVDELEYKGMRMRCGPGKKKKKKGPEMGERKGSARKETEDIQMGESDGKERVDDDYYYYHLSRIRRRSKRQGRARRNLRACFYYSNLWCTYLY